MVLDELRYPIVLAPLAGGPSTPALAAAVCEAGGLGFLAAGYLSPEAFGDRLRELRGLTSLPVGVNLFVPGSEQPDAGAVERYAASLHGEEERYGVPVGVARADDDGWESKLALLLAEPVDVVSFTFGCPPPATLQALRAAGSETWVTVTSVAEAVAARDAGADVLVLQGLEAGGHRGTWIDADTDDLALLTLLRLAADAVDMPLVAAGGIADGAGLAAVLAAGADAAQIGTAFLGAPEAGTSPAHVAALTAASSTAVTRAFTGRRARGVANRFLREHSADAPAAYPHLHHLTAPLRAEARARGDADGFNLWAGQAHPLVRIRPAGETVRALAAEAREAAARAASRLAPP